jgi:hypothetical protein
VYKSLPEFKDVCFKQITDAWLITARHLKRNLKTVFKRRMPSGMIAFCMLIMRCMNVEES